MSLIQKFKYIVTKIHGAIMVTKNFELYTRFRNL